MGDETGGPTLALATHLDVVPPGEGWTRSPFEPVIEEGRLYGRGSGDAKASVAAMIMALADVADEGGPTRGSLLAILSFGEETRFATMPEALQAAGRIDAAIVGEPTNLQPAVAQRGLMMVNLIARGEQRHAGNAGGAPNAILALAAELGKLGGILDDRIHPVLGRATVTPTMLEAGVSRNVTPALAKALLDIRSIPEWTHDEIEARLKERLACEVEVTSKRHLPCETPAGSRLLAAMQRVNPAIVPYGSPTCSDWCFLRHVDAVKLGPGTSRRSHTPDECVELEEVSMARQFYARVAREYLA